MSDRLFVLDTNVFVQAAEWYYAFDFNTPFWDLLIEQGKRNRICTIDRVAQEIGDRGDLPKWFDEHFKPFVKQSNDVATLQAYGELMNWSQTQDFTPAAKAEFANATEADAWLVAFARTQGATVVTFEKNDPSMKRKVQVPIACKFLQVPVMDTFKMMRQLGLRFRE